MKQINWEKFAARVPAGTRIKGDYASPGDGNWEGILLENKPHNREDFIAEVWAEDDKKIKQAVMGQWLKMQSFSEIEDSRVMLDYPDVQYLIDGQWLTVDEVMAQAR